MFECFDLRYFLGSFFIGLFFVYIFAPEPEIIYRYPTPDNSGKVIYKDSNDICYTYKAEQVKCGTDAIDTPVQTVHNKQMNKKSEHSMFSKLFDT